MDVLGEIAPIHYVAWPLLPPILPPRRDSRLHLQPLRNVLHKVVASHGTTVSLLQDG